MKSHSWLGFHMVSIGTLSLGLLFAAIPASDNYTLKSYDIGSGGSSSSSSTNYRLNGVTGSQNGTSSTGQNSTNFGVEPGVNNTTNANVPPAPAFTNPEGYYDRLKLVINTGNNPADAKYLIAISSDSFATTQYVQADNSIGSSQAIANYQTYTAWGGAGGFTILGLKSSTAYQVKVKAIQGSFTGTAFGPTASATTGVSSVSMSLTSTLTSTPPFLVNFSNLTAGSVVNGAADAIIGLSSNAANGGTVYLRGTNGGLLSTSVSNTITSATTDLSSASSGYGAQVTSVGQISGGPLARQSPFNGNANSVGGITSALQPIITTTSPVTAGQGTLRLMAKAAVTTPSASDYADILTLVIAMNF